MNAAMYSRLARAEARKLLTTRALPIAFAASVALTVISVVLDAMVAGKQGQPPLGTDESTNQMLKFGAVPCLVMLILGIMSAGGEFRHRTIIPVLLATPKRGSVFAVKVAVVAVAGAAFSAVTFGLGLAAIVAELHAHGLHHLPGGTARLYAGTVLASTCLAMIGVALGALTRNTLGAIVAVIAWTLLIEQVILQTVVPGVEKWLPTAAAITLTNPLPGGHPLAASVAGLLLAGYAAALLAAAGATTLRRDIA